ncbi:MAG: TraB/GumN family protein [Spirochaetales bacterium]|nr:TraB/GumN family protein [Spirochaetales bacterium]
MMKYNISGNKTGRYVSCRTGVSLLLVFFLLNACGSTQEKGTGSTKIFLWEVESETTTCYLLGSIHLAPKEVYPLADIIEQAFDYSDILVVEIDVTAAAAGEDFYERTMYPPGETLKMHISEELYELTRKTLDDLGLGIGFFKLFKPWAVAMTIETLKLADKGYDPELGIDMYFLKKARGNKEIRELESIEFQVDLFDGLSDELQEQFLYSTISGLDNSDEEIDEFLEAWKTGDTERLETLLFESMQKDRELLPVYDKLLHERNANMVQKIEGYLETDRVYFVVVGAAHLIGETGIVRRLEEKGYRCVQF